MVVEAAGNPSIEHTQGLHAGSKLCSHPQAVGTMPDIFWSSPANRFGCHSYKLQSVVRELYTLAKINSVSRYTKPGNEYPIGFLVLPQNGGSAHSMDMYRSRLANGGLYPCECVHLG